MIWSGAALLMVLASIHNRLIGTPASCVSSFLFDSKPDIFSEKISEFHRNFPIFQKLPLDQSGIPVIMVSNCWEVAIPRNFPNIGFGTYQNLDNFGSIVIGSDLSLLLMFFPELMFIIRQMFCNLEIGHLYMRENCFGMITPASVFITYKVEMNTGAQGMRGIEIVILIEMLTRRHEWDVRVQIVGLKSLMVYQVR